MGVEASDTCGLVEILMRNKNLIPKVIKHLYNVNNVCIRTFQITSAKATFRLPQVINSVIMKYTL